MDQMARVVSHCPSEDMNIGHKLGLTPVHDLSLVSAPRINMEIQSNPTPLDDFSASPEFQISNSFLPLDSTNFDEDLNSLPLLNNTLSKAAPDKEEVLRLNNQNQDLMSKIDSHIEFNSVLGISCDHPNMKNLCKDIIERNEVANMEVPEVKDDDSLGDLDSGNI